jgi:integrase
MPSIRAPKLETRTARLKLPRRKKPHFVAIAPRIGLGYRRTSGAGTWVVRAADGHGGNWTKAFAVADDFEDSNGNSVLTFWDAQDRARALARADEGNSSAERPATVGEAIDAYTADLLARGARKANATQLAFNVPDTLAAKPVATLSARELRVWRNGMVKRGIKPTSADRVARVLKAALNLAAADDTRIRNAKEWREGLKPLPDGDVARNIILADPVVAAVVRAAYANDPDPMFGLTIETLAETGAREIQLLRLVVADLIDASNNPRLMMPSSRKGRSRYITRTPVAISTRLARKLRQFSRSRSAEAPLLDPVKHIAARFRAATKTLDLDPRATPYALRHSSIVRMLLASVPVRVVAVHHNTSVKMIERHYSAFIADVSDALTRGTLLDLDQPAGAVVVPLRGA